MGARWTEPAPPPGDSVVQAVAGRVGTSFLTLPLGWQVLIAVLVLAVAVLMAT